MIDHLKMLYAVTFALHIAMSVSTTSAVAESDREPADATSTHVSDKVAEILQDGSSDEHLAAYRRFADEVVQSMTAVSEWNEAAKKQVAGSIAQIVRIESSDREWEAKTPVAEVAAVLDAIRETHRDHLATITDEWFERDWEAARAEYASALDGEWEHIESVLDHRPMLLVSREYNLLIAEGGTDRSDREALTEEIFRNAASATDPTELQERAEVIIARRAAVYRSNVDSAVPLLGNIFIAESRAFEALDPKGLDAYGRYVRSRLMVDNVAVVDIGFFGALGNLSLEGRLLMFGADVPVEPTRGETLALLATSLRALELAGVVEPFPIEIGDGVPAWMRSSAGVTARLGKDGLEEVEPDLAGAAPTDQFREDLSRWAAIVVGDLDLPNRLAGDIVAAYLQSFQGRVATLPEFGGPASTDEVELDEINQELLTLLREDVAEGTLFDEAREPDPVTRGAAFWERLYGEGGDASRYQTVRTKLTEWTLAQYHERYTTEQIEAVERKGRAYRLFSLALTDAKSRGEISDEESRLGGGAVHNAWRRLDELGAFASAPLSAEQLAKESSLVQKLYRFYGAALPNAPMFQELDDHTDGQAEWEAYRSHLNLEEEKEEREARENVLAELKA